VSLADDETTATLSRTLNGANTTLTLARPGSAEVTWSGLQTPIAFHAQIMPDTDNNTLTFENGTVLKITTGTLESLEPEGYVPALVVGMGKLTLEDPMAKKYPLVRIAPVDGVVVIAVRHRAA
jgi:hypothetical protein